MNVLTERLEAMGGRVSAQELAYQMRQRGMPMSVEEVENNLRHEELAGRVESYTYFKAVATP